MKKSLLLTMLIAFVFQSSYSQYWYELGSTPGTSLSSLFDVNPSGNGKINTLVTDTLGNLYAAGGFLDINGNNFVAKWNGSQWVELGGTVPGFLQHVFENIYALTFDNKGNLYAAAWGGDSINNAFIAKWNGVTWKELGTGGLGFTWDSNGNFGPNTICTDPSGNVYTAGQFSDGNGNSYVAKWDGNQWTELGGTVPGIGLNGTNSGNTGNQINAIVSDKYGNIYAGGNFTDSDGYKYVAKWNGTKWNKLGTTTGIALNAQANIQALAVDKLGNVYAAGDFGNLSGHAYVAKWNGIMWSEVTSTVSGNTFEFDGSIETLNIDTAGNIYSAGQFHYVAKWNGTSWSKLGQTSTTGDAFTDYINTVSTDKSGNVYVGGVFKDGSNNNYVAKYPYTAKATGLFTPTYTSSLTAFPNPTANGVNVIATENGTLTVYNSLGEVVAQKGIDSGNSNIDLTGYQTGIYTLVFQASYSSNSYAPLKVIKN